MSTTQLSSAPRVFGLGIGLFLCTAMGVIVISTSLLLQQCITSGARRNTRRALFWINFVHWLVYLIIWLIFLLPSKGEPGNVLQVASIVDRLYVPRFSLVLLLVVGAILVLILGVRDCIRRTIPPLHTST